MHPSSPADLAASRRRILAAAGKVQALMAELADGGDSPRAAEWVGTPAPSPRDMRLIIRELQMVVYGLMALEKQLVTNEANQGDLFAADGIDAQTPERMAA